MGNVLAVRELIKFINYFSSLDSSIYSPSIRARRSV